MIRAGVFAIAVVLALGRPAGAAEPAWAPAAVAVAPDPAAAVPAPPDSAPGVAAGTAAPAASESAAAPVPAPSLGAATLRVAGATALVAVLLGLTLCMLRALYRGRGRAPRGASAATGWRAWCARWITAPTAPADRLDVLARSHVGAKESVCIIRAGSERFLVGVTAHQIALLGRLDPIREAGDLGEAAAPPVEEPAAIDFAQALAGATASRAGVDEVSVRALLDRSRQRVSRLGASLVPSGADRA
jgi:hypothetical protein